MLFRSRRAHLVADVGQEGGLGLVGGLDLAQAAQVLVGFAARGDVLDGADQAPAGDGLPNGPLGRLVFGIEVPAVSTLAALGP